MTDGGGMCLLVHPNGGKYWRLAYRFGGKQKTLALGVYPDISLADARDRREQARKLLTNDADPGAVKQAQKAAKVEATSIRLRDRVNMYSPTATVPDGLSAKTPY